MRSRDEPLGFILESDVYGVAQAALRADVAAPPGIFVEIEAGGGTVVLGQIRSVRSRGGVFTESTAAYLLRNLNAGEFAKRAEEVFLLAEVAVHSSRDANGGGGQISAVLPGALLRWPERRVLQSRLALDGDVALGKGWGGKESRVGIPSAEVQRAHCGILGQTGSGKTNVLHLLRQGLERLRNASYVVFDFHGEFAPRGSEEVVTPPFRFAPSDLSWELLRELLPDLSSAQEDLLVAALDDSARSLGEIKERIGSVRASVATKRVLVRRLGRLERTGAFAPESTDIGSRVLENASRAGHGVLMKLHGIGITMSELFIAAVVRRLLWTRMQGRGCPIVILVDEAHRLMSPLSPAFCLRVFRAVAQEGRKFGVTMVAATQRPSLIDATVFSQLGTIVGLRITSPEDTREVAQAVGEVRASDFPLLQVGEGILRRAWSPDLVWLKFDRAEGC